MNFQSVSTSDQEVPLVYGQRYDEGLSSLVSSAQKIKIKEEVKNQDSSEVFQTREDILAVESQELFQDLSRMQDQWTQQARGKQEQSVPDSNCMLQNYKSTASDSEERLMIKMEVDQSSCDGERNEVLQNYQQDELIKAERSRLETRATVAYPKEQASNGNIQGFEDSNNNQFSFQHSAYNINFQAMNFQSCSHNSNARGNSNATNTKKRCFDCQTDQQWTGNGYSQEFQQMQTFANAMQDNYREQSASSFYETFMSPSMYDKQQQNFKLKYRQYYDFERSDLLGMKSEQKPYPRRGSLQLWQFLVALLSESDCRQYIAWTGRDFEFKLIDPEEVARRWGIQKNRPAMNYDKLSRSLRYYYEKGIMQKVAGERYVYRFVCGPENLFEMTYPNMRPLLKPECHQPSKVTEEQLYPENRSSFTPQAYLDRVVQYCYQPYFNETIPHPC